MAGRVIEKGMEAYRGSAMEGLADKCGESVLVCFRTRAQPVVLALHGTIVQTVGLSLLSGR